MDHGEYTERSTLLASVCSHPEMKDFAEVVFMQPLRIQFQRVRVCMDKFEELAQRFQLGLIEASFAEILLVFNSKVLAFGDIGQNYLETVESDRPQLMNSFEVTMAETMTVVDTVENFLEETKALCMESFMVHIRAIFGDSVQEQLDALCSSWIRDEINDNTLMERATPLLGGPCCIPIVAFLMQMMR